MLNEGGGQGPPPTCLTTQILPGSQAGKDQELGTGNRLYLVELIFFRLKQAMTSGSTYWGFAPFRAEMKASWAGTGRCGV